MISSSFGSRLGSGSGARLGLRTLTVGVAAGVLALPLSLSAPALSIEDGATSWHAPRCGSVSGAMGALSFTRNDGSRIVSTTDAITPVSYTHLAALSTPNLLIGVSKDTIWSSSDAGCSWTSLASPKNLSQYDVATSGDIAWVYGINDQELFRVQGHRVTTVLGPVEYDGVAGFWTDPSAPDHLRVVDKDGQIHDSTDGGATWTKIGVPATSPYWAYTAAIDPTNPDHIVVGAIDEGFVTFDGGGTWTAMDGNGTGHANVFSVAYSPVDSSTVWIEGYDMTVNGNGARKIWRSDDGGRTFTQELDGTQVTLVNGTDLWPSPADRDVLYFAFGTWFGNYGTDLYRYSAASGTVSSTHSGYDGIDSLVFSPANPNVMYLGLSEER